MVGQSSLFFQDLDLFGDSVALVSASGQAISYAHLAQQADRHVAELGAERRLLMIGMAPTVDCVAAYLGALRAGHAAILVDPFANDRIESLIRDFAVEAYYGSAADGWIRQSGATRAVPPLHNELAILLGTSGSSGATKLVRLSAVTSMRMPDPSPSISACGLTIGRSQPCHFFIPTGFQF